MSIDSPESGTSRLRDFTELEFGVTNSDCLAGSLSANGAASVVLENRTQLDENSFVEFYTACECRPEGIQSHADRVESISAVSILCAKDDQVCFQVTTADPGPLSIIEHAGAIATSVRFVAGNGELRVLVPPGIKPGEVVTAVLTIPGQVELLARREVPMSALVNREGLGRTMPKRLTDRQWEVISTAYRMGYFDRPRAKTGEEIADRLGISSATFSQHLRAAQRSIFGALIETAAD